MNAQEVKPEDVHRDSETNRAYDKDGQPLVIVDPMKAIRMNADGTSGRASYRERRARWSETFSLQASNFVPRYYLPHYIDLDYLSVYNQQLPLMEGNLVFKRNLPFGAIGAEIGAGYFKTTSNPSLATADATPLNSALELVILRLGLQLSFDALMSEPYVVPYVSGGIYSFDYRESQPTNAYTGITQPAPYLTAGLMFQLNWIDQASAETVYDDAGLENTFLFIEVRSLFDSGNSQDPKFNSAPHFDAGMRMEF
jgi:hypothetical protein